jgi:hypothetical protein
MNLTKMTIKKKEGRALDGYKLHRFFTSAPDGDE